MRKTTVYWLTCVLTILAASTVSATTIVLPTDGQLIAKSPVIVEGTVVSVTPVDREGRIWTDTVVAVSQTLKGSSKDRITVSEIGGEIGGRITKLFGSPEFSSGEQVLLFLERRADGSYRTMDLFVGKFHRDETLDGRGVFVRKDEADRVTLLDASFRPLETGNVQRDADGFRKFVAARAAGRQGDSGYGIENPVLRSRVKPAGGGRAMEDFTLISEPRVYRWFAFDNGGSARWYHYGTQPGYSGGGLTEMATGMTSWTGYSGARINYVHSGALSGSPAGLTNRNNANEVLFNDPLNEIAGSWSPSTGGVVGQGGFNGVSGSSAWNAPFTADDTHTQRAYTAYNIVEGNLTIQDGVSPSANISSIVLAEILAHEFGHTLGFGHSADNTALMYATVTRIGPSLRADDQVAARWLYPNGTVQPPPAPAVPAAPSNLTAAASGTSASLQWTDNAGNETAQQIWVAPATGSFSKVADMAANVTSATLTGLASGTTYRIYVTASNAAGASAASNVATVSIAAAPTPLSPSFTFTPPSAVTGQDVQFIDQSSGGATAWQWNFGDGTMGSQQVAVKRYSAPGQYLVTLTIFRGAESASTSRTITIQSPAPVTPSVSASFGFSPSAPQAGQNVSFFDQSSHATSWQWNFGDGTGSNSQNPSHVFPAPGAYTVTLLATNSVSSSSASRTVVVASNTQTFRSLVSAAAQTAGQGGSDWRTELTLFNAGNGTPVSLTFIPGAGQAVQSRTLYLANRQSVTWSNTLPELFGIASGSGAIAIEASGAGFLPAIHVTSRTFTTGSAGTYGQAIPGVSPTDLDPTVYLTGLVSNAAYRTNVGLVNRSSSWATATLTVYAGNGSPVAERSIDVPPNNFQQTALTKMFTNLAGASFDVLSIRVSSSASAAISAYASVVDNRSQDPVYVGGARPAAAASLVLPAVGRVPGANGTFWRSDVTIFNPGAGKAVMLRFLPADRDNRSAAASSVFVPSGQTVVLADVLSRLGLTSGSGALELSWTGTSPIVTSRTYTTVAAGGTYGQSIEPIARWRNDAVVTGFRSDSAYRTNAGFVNGSDSTMSIGLTLLSQTGGTLATNVVSIPARSQNQWSLASLFPGLDTGAIGSATLLAHTDGAAALFAYGSMVDNTSGDPVFLAGE